jgi:hypothetical protein
MFDKVFVVAVIFAVDKIRWRFEEEWKFLKNRNGWTNNMNHYNKNNTQIVCLHLGGINISIYHLPYQQKAISPRAQNPCH